MSLTESTGFSWVRNHHSSTLLPRVSKEISVCIPGPHTWGFQLLHHSWVCYRILQHLRPVLEPNQTQTFAFEVINFCSFLPSSFFSTNIENGSGFLVKTWSDFAVRQIWDFFWDRSETFSRVFVCVSVPVPTGVCVFKISRAFFQIMGRSNSHTEYMKAWFLSCLNQRKHLNFDLLQPT